MSEVYRLMSARPQAPALLPTFLEWNLPNGDVWVAFYRMREGFLLRFPGLADFEISASGHAATCWPVPDLPEATREHLFLNQVLPLMLSEQGRLVFHASCVEFGGGAIAFLGPTGQGKSTIATAFAVAGDRFLTDDVLIVEPTCDGYLALPGHPSIRLWKDSREALLSPSLEAAPRIVLSKKSRILAAVEMPHCAAPRQLIAAYLLGDADTDRISFRKLCGADTVAAWLRNSFILDVENSARLRTSLDSVVQIAEIVPTIALDYPRDYRALSSIRRAIIDHAERA